MKEWMDVQFVVKKKMEVFGFEMVFDDVGNVFGRLSGLELLDEVILIGLYIDIVIDGGKYDGVFGVLVGMLVICYLYEMFGCLKKILEVVLFCEEEGSCFFIIYWGLGNIIGVFLFLDVEMLRDVLGIFLKEVMWQNGFGVGCYFVLLWIDIKVFLEVYIEQG